MNLVVCVLVAVLLPYGRCDDFNQHRDELAHPSVVAPKIKRQAQSGFSIPNAILSLALDMGRCRSTSANDCSSNTVYSPLSIASTLTMLLMGTSGNSYSQLRTALKYPAEVSDSDINTAFKFLMERMRSVDSQAGSSIVLNVVNGLFSQKNSGFNNDYIIQAKDFYLSEIAELDFLRSSFSATGAINQWVSEKTQGKITNILSNLQPETQLVVANAVYFNANWADPFSPDLTREAEFKVSPTETLSIPTMFQHAEVAYVDSSELGCKMIGIPYKGEDLGMFIMVPKQKKGLESLNRLEANLNGEVLEHLFSKMESKLVSIQLPKFRIKQQLQLKSALRDLGVTDLFSTTSANLSRMMAKAGAALDNVVHQTFIEVTESGTEAAAATIVSLSRDGPSKSFAANRPFLFLIRDIPSKSVLFWGRVVRPEAPQSF